jgi:hypothetical protein
MAYSKPASLAGNRRSDRVRSMIRRSLTPALARRRVGGDRATGRRASRIPSINRHGRERFRGLKEMIKTIAPLKVEEVLAQHPDVVQVYVVGIPDATKGRDRRRRGSSRGPAR